MSFKSIYILLLFLLTLDLVQSEELWDRVKRVVDGDTVVLESLGTVRLIGVDTPETVHPKKPVEFYGREASNFTKSLLSKKRVRVEYDWNKKDKYQRGLVYLYLEDGTMVNRLIVAQGFGHAYTRFPFKYLEDFRKAEKKAREEKLGLWAEEKSIAQVVSPAKEAESMDQSKCRIKKTCPQMSSCEEAKFYLTVCGHKARDRDKDGIPCENVCK
jgi:endonuclease YncB( thermonuclease family)